MRIGNVNGQSLIVGYHPNQEEESEYFASSQRSEGLLEGFNVQFEVSADHTPLDLSKDGEISPMMSPRQTIRKTSKQVEVAGPEIMSPYKRNIEPTMLAAEPIINPNSQSDNLLYLKYKEKESSEQEQSSKNDSNFLQSFNSKKNNVFPPTIVKQANKLSR